ncbi:transposase [Corynebacterium guangdongense]|uniref:Transposase-like protein n=1 Tax=Corynebacterium guangdongense TaxID=1783348 RepID=A0ABU1ZYB5_9CORY|nr:transposase [Corynebacterium guangdongense]MDR7329891.1 transposase-like protein [Corynebacterium guangdongense]
MPSKYTLELKQRAVELVLHAQANPDTARGAITRIAGELGLSKETLRVWVRAHKQSGIDTPAESIDLAAENRRLRAELAEAKRANDILKKASAFSRRSQAAHPSNRHLHRRQPCPGRGRAHHPCSGYHQREDCPEHVLRPQITA